MHGRERGMTDAEILAALTAGHAIERRGMR